MKESFVSALRTERRLFHESRFVLGLLPTTMSLPLETAGKNVFPCTSQQDKEMLQALSPKTARISKKCTSKKASRYSQEAFLLSIMVPWEGLEPSRA